MDERIGGWMGEWMDGWVDRWMEEWVGSWLDGSRKDESIGRLISGSVENEWPVEKSSCETFMKQYHWPAVIDITQ